MAFRVLPCSTSKRFLPFQHGATDGMYSAFSLREFFDLTDHLHLLQCLGQQLAYLQASYVWVRLLQHPIITTRSVGTQSTGTVPPPLEWSRRKKDDSRHARETVWPYSDVVLRIKVRSTADFSFQTRKTLKFIQRAACGFKLLILGMKGSSIIWLYSTHIIFCTEFLRLRS
jgi:hypothetical protein